MALPDLDRSGHLTRRGGPGVDEIRLVLCV